jgi:RNA polymerase sigma-70 factor, ECF subfamily
MTAQRATQPAPRVEPHAPDPDVLRRLAAGEIGALGELYDRYHATVRAFVARATADASDVDDLVHATFLAAVQSAARYDGRASCKPWLIGIAVHMVQRRRQGFGRLRAVLSSLGVLHAATVDPRDAMHAKTDVERALTRLSENKRVTLLMAELEGMTGPEIAAATGVPVGTVWTRLHAARRELRRLLEERDEP